jgi:hypothetical protein
MAKIGENGQDFACQRAYRCRSRDKATYPDIEWDREPDLDEFDTAYALLATNGSAARSKFEELAEDQSRVWRIWEMNIPLGGFSLRILNGTSGQKQMVGYKDLTVWVGRIIN